MRPPSVGPITPAMPYMLVTRAIPNGRFFNGTDLPNIAKLPHNRPAAPAPDMALPSINAAEFGEAAHSIEPPSTIYDCQIICSSVVVIQKPTNDNRGQIEYLSVEQGVQPPKAGLKRHLGEKICATIPGYIVKPMEISCYTRNRSSFEI